MIRKSDVLWEKRIWREIDLKEKGNKHIVSSIEGVNLFNILIKEINAGNLIAYSAIDDRFSLELTKEQINIRLVDSSFVYPINQNGEPDKKKKELHFTSSTDIIKYWLKEDWFFNNRTSEIEARILGICPIRLKKNTTGIIIGVEQLFWIYFPNARDVLNNYDALAIEKEIIKNDDEEKEEETMTFDDVFRKRIFSSYVIEKSNVRNSNSNSKTNVDIFLEGQKTKRYYFNKEHDMWTY